MEAKIKEAYYECPNFNQCSVNNCPISTQNFESIDDDPELKCKCRINIRKQIAEKYGLEKFMTVQELNREKRREKSREKWDKLSEYEKFRRINVLSLSKNARITKNYSNYPYNFRTTIFGNGLDTPCI